MTIVEAAEKAIRTLGGAPSLTSIYETIIAEQLFVFDTNVPEHVLRTQIHRHCSNVARVDNVSEPRFTRVGEDSYAMIDTVSRTTGMRRIHRAKDKESIINQLKDDLGVFRDIWRVLLFAATLGARAGRRVPLGETDSGKGIDQSTFGNCSAWPGIVHLMALVEDRDPTVLSDISEEARIKLFEEYANGGLELLQDHFKTAPMRMQSLIDLADKFTTKAEGPNRAIDLTI